MSDIAREMLRMFGLGMGLDVVSNQRLAKARELRERDLDREPEVSLKPKLRVIHGSAPWIPPTLRVKKK